MKLEEIARLGMAPFPAAPHVRHDEPPSAPWTPCRIINRDVPFPGGAGDEWENDRYYGTVRRFNSGSFVGNGPYRLIGISSKDETARHDWRDFQRIKNDLAGREWEAVELYPAESRLVDPTNRFYLWCVPNRLQFGFPGRRVIDGCDAPAPQRPFPPGEKPEAR